MNLYRRNNRHGGVRPLMVATLLVALVLALDLLAGGIVRDQARSAAALVWSGMGNAHEGLRQWNFFADRRELLEENRALTSEVASLSALRLENDIVRAENTALRDLLAVPEHGRAVATARVLSRPHASPYGTFVIGAGSDDGVSVGDHVLAPGSISLGRVAEVSAGTAVVEMFLRNGNEVEVIIAEDALVSVAGQGGSTGLSEVPRSITVAEGDPVLLPNSGFAIGTIGRIQTPPAAAFQQVFITVPLNIQTLRFVRVMSL